MRSFSLPSSTAATLPHNISPDPYLFAERCHKEKLDESAGSDPQHFYMDDFIQHEEATERAINPSTQSRMKAPIEKVTRYFARHYASANPLYREIDFGGNSDNDPTPGELPLRAHSCFAAIVPVNTAYRPHARPKGKRFHVPVLHAMLRRIFLLCPSCIPHFMPEV